MRYDHFAVFIFCLLCYTVEKGKHLIKLYVGGCKMKKILVVMTFVYLTCLFTSCHQSEKNDIKDFFQQLTVEDISNTVEVDRKMYSVFLSSNSPWVYFTMSTSTEHFILVKEERSFAYLMDDNATLYEYYSNKKHVYSFDRQMLQLTKHEDDASTIISTINEDYLLDVVNSVKLDLNQSGDLLSFDSLYAFISEAFRDVQTNELELFGSNDYMISRSFDSSHFLTNIPSFRLHISSLYSSAQMTQISASFENNLYKSISVRVAWHATNDMLKPYIEISRNQLVYYTINPMEQDYSIN